MEISHQGYEKSELLKVAEEIYASKSKKQNLELELSSERFHYENIAKRKELIGHEVVYRLFWIIPYTCLLIVGIWILIFCLLNPDEVSGDAFMGIALLAALLIIAYFGYQTVGLWLQEIRMIKLFLYSKKASEIPADAEKEDVDTFQKEIAVSEKKIEQLESEIAGLEQRIIKLTAQKEKILAGKSDEWKNREYEKPNQEDDSESIKKNGKIALKYRDVSIDDKHMVYEYYLNKERYVNYRLIELDGKIEYVNKEIVAIEDDFEGIKRQVIFFGIVFLFLILIQGMLEGALATFSAIVCFAGMLFYMLYLEKKCKRPFLAYMVEHDSNLTKSYAFRTNMIPCWRKREELFEIRRNCEQELAEIKIMKEMLDFD